jgi:hypothetical protein
MVKWNRKLIGLIVLLTCVLFAATAMAKDAQPSGTVSIELTSVAVGIGGEWGHGVLTFQGKEYKFKMNGFSVVDVGVSKISATGHVYHLKNVSDFAGTFSAAEAGIAIGAGAGASTMKNQNGVVMNLTSKKSGIKFKLAAEGVKIEMVE